MRKRVLVLIIPVLSFLNLISTTAENIPAEINVNIKNNSYLNLTKAIEITEKALAVYFVGDDMRMSRFYNPYTEVRSEEVGSIWMYTSAVEAINAILKSLKAENGTLYRNYYNKFTNILADLYSNADYYLGTFTLTSYTQTKEWTVYGVHRGKIKGSAKVEGIENVYDDQMWLIRELLESYNITGNSDYLSKAEYLTEYVLDGWDCTIDVNGIERGGIPWGPGYVTKHACSNGPLISPLVWLHEIYADKNDVIEYRYISKDDAKTREIEQMKKSDYYLMFAKKVYDWQKHHLLRADGVYDDMMGGCNPGVPEIEIVNGIEYRRGITCRKMAGPAITYNTGTMLSGAADLYRATGDNIYVSDGMSLADAGFTYFTKLDADVDGYYTFDVSGFRNWFNGVLLRGYIDFYPYYNNVENYIDAFNMNLKYGYDNWLYNGILPTNLLAGWEKDSNKNVTEGMFSFSFGAAYAVLDSHSQK